MYGGMKILFLTGIILFILFSFSSYGYCSKEISLNTPQMVSLKIEPDSAEENKSTDTEAVTEETKTESPDTESAEGSPEENVEATSETNTSVEEEPTQGEGSEVTENKEGNEEMTGEKEEGSAETEEASDKEEGKGAPPPVDNRWFRGERTNMLIAIIFLSAFIMYFIFSAQKGAELFVRRIAGLSALDDAVGRATEMGKAVLYIPGIMDMDDIQTLAGLSILSYVAEKTAEYDTPIMVPTSRSLVMSTAHEVVKEAYMRAGRPDAFRADNIRYLTDDQFGFVAGVDGIMVREKPAANFYMGCFYAESLILAETGHSTGAIQMAGTAMPSQLPFFVAACDYTLIGEELFAASAYLSRDPQQLGSLKGQDVGKLILLLCIILGCILETAGIKTFTALFETK